MESFSRVKDIVKKDDIIFGTIGTHPHEADKNKIDKEFIGPTKIIKEYSDGSEIKVLDFVRYKVGEGID